MAKDKKGFVLYADQKSIFDDLTNEEAGLLIKHIFSYVNDENPELIDRLLDMAFKPIKAQLKRDLVKYEEVKERNSANARKRWDTVALSGIPKDTKNADKDKGNGIVKDKGKDIYIPSESEFLEYCKTIKEFEFKNYEFSLKAKYESWVNAGWKDGNGDKIKVWKTKIKNTYPYLKPIFTNTDNTEPVKKRNQPA